MSAALIKLPPGLPALRDIRYPEGYTRVRQQIVQYCRIDECKDWADKMQAIGTYAKLADDKELEHAAIRIRDWAMRRVGELLKEIEPQQGVRTDLAGELQEPRLPRLTRERAAEEAGLSEHQRKTALRLANIPEREFAAKVEAGEPAGIKELAQLGKRPGPAIDLKGRDPADFAKSTEAQGAIRDFYAMTRRIDFRVAIAGAMPTEWKRMESQANECLAWLDALIAQLESQQ